MVDLKFDRVSKTYRIQREPGGAPVPISQRLRGFARRHREFWAIKDMSFEVTRGQTLGIIGPNGAGKSTILKLLSKITAPSSGEIMINGRLSALIEVGSGFHPELTGRENIYLSGSILGMRRREISNKLESIIDFAGVRQFIDTPVKRYSSGMYVRLGFAIAAHLHSDILLLDEVLAVGDAAFQTKCYKRINDLKKRGTTIVFISHDLNAVAFLCDRALLLDSGEIIADGLPREVIKQYNQATRTGVVSPTKDAFDNHRPILITRLTFHDAQGAEVSRAFTGMPHMARIEYKASEPIKDIGFELFYYSENGKLHCQFSTALDCDRIDINRGEGAIQFSCAELGLQPGVYYADATIRRKDGEEIDWQYRSAVLRVDPGKSVLGSFYSPHQWRVDQHTDQYEEEMLLTPACTH